VSYLGDAARGVVATVDRLGARMGATVLGEALPAVIGLGIWAAGPVVLHVGVSFTEEPIEGATYEPTDGATVDPYPELRLAPARTCWGERRLLPVRLS
jgi:hypothetical protein